MERNGDAALTRRELMRRSGLAAGSLLAPAIRPIGEAAGAPGADAPLPAGVKAVWDLEKAHREKTPTRERICLNGLWRWQPAREGVDAVPADKWGFFKAPGAWPGVTDYMQKDCQTVFAHPDWSEDRLGEITSAWYQREISVPAGWSGRAIRIAAEVVNSLAVVYVDGAKVGEIRFPAGEIDISGACRPGASHLLTMHVTALPLKSVMLSFIDTNAAKQVKGSVARRGLCGDVKLLSSPTGARIEEVKIATSVRNGTIAFDAALAGLQSGVSYTLRAQVREAAPSSMPHGAAMRSGGGWGTQRVPGVGGQESGGEQVVVAGSVGGDREDSDGIQDASASSGGLGREGADGPRVAVASSGGTGRPPAARRSQPEEGARVVREFVSPPFHADDLKGGVYSFSEKWRPKKLWDLHTPENQYSVQVSLVEAGGKAADTDHARRFGFRELWIQGRDFYLNGSRLFLAVVPIDNAAVGAAWSTYEGARETMERMKSIGINFVYTHNYGCEPGTHLSFTEILRAADDAGMLVAFSQPHFSHYDWKAPDADANNGYAHHAEFYVRTAGSHPSVVCYAMSHNATGYVEEMNPDMIDGIQEPRESWGMNNARLALRAEAIVKRFDPHRIVYHHSSGNLGSMHTSNFYINFTPIQELSDWFEHWATVGVKPAYLCEYGVPFSWDWAMYRGWYQGKREWGSAPVPWEFCLAEWNAQFFGDRAYKISDRERVNLRWEAAQFKAGRVWHRWDYPTSLGSGAFSERNPIFGDYITDNWRAYRTWGLSAFSPWEHAMMWTLRPGVDTRRKALPVDWDHLQRPGFSPDYVQDQPEDRLVAFERADWVPTDAALAVIRNNRPLLAYIAGKPARFTSKDHNFLPGETVEKQLVVINNSRVPVSAECGWAFGARAVGVDRTDKTDKTGAGHASGRAAVRALPTGEQTRIPVRFMLPADLAAGHYELTATVRFNGGEVQQDTFAIDVLPAPAHKQAVAKIALYDPKGETARLLAGLGVTAKSVDVAADLSAYDLLIIGKGALTPAGPGPDIRAVRDGLKVVVLEQTADTMEQRFGFRIAEYGLRQAFPRVPGHALLAGLETENLRDWQGEATTSTPRLKYTIGQRNSPQVKWCGMDVTRVWRCGCRGNVASVMIEKPAMGDFLPVIDGGYALQYSPLMEYREGKGMVLFCQMDVTGRTELDPAAMRLARNIVEHALAWKPSPVRECAYVGEPAGHAHLEAAGFAPVNAAPDSFVRANSVLVVGPGGTEQAAALRDWIHGGGHVLAIGLDEAGASAFLPSKVQMRRAEYIATHFDPAGPGSWLAGVCPADVHNRDPRMLPLVSGGATVVGNGVLAASENGNVVFSQLAPWQFDPTKQMNLKRTFRRVSFLTARLLSNLGAASATPVLERFHSPVASGERRWLDGLYLDTPEEWDDPYRFFGW